MGRGRIESEENIFPWPGMRSLGWKSSPVTWFMWIPGPTRARILKGAQKKAGEPYTSLNPKPLHPVWLHGAYVSGNALGAEM